MITDTIKVENTGDWETYTTVSMVTSKLSKGDSCIKTWNHGKLRQYW